MTDTNGDIGGRLLVLENRMLELEKGQAIYITLFEKNLGVQERLSASIDKLNDTMSDIKLSLSNAEKDTAFAIKTIDKIEMQLTEIKEDEKEIKTSLENKIKILEDSLKTNDDKSKLDITKLITTGITNFVVGGGLLALIILLIKLMTTNSP